MRMTIIGFLLLALSVSPAFAQLSACNDNYDSCISDCCASCGSTLSTDSNGDLVCDVGTQSNPNQECIDACTPCSTQYQDCVAAYGGGTGSSGSSSSCCGSATMLAGIIGFAFIRKQ